MTVSTRYGSHFYIFNNTLLSKFLLRDADGAIVYCRMWAFETQVICGLFRKLIIWKINYFGLFGPPLYCTIILQLLFQDIYCIHFTFSLGSLCAPFLVFIVTLSSSITELSQNILTRSHISPGVSVSPLLLLHKQWAFRVSEVDPKLIKAFKRCVGSFRGGFQPLQNVRILRWRLWR